MSTDEKKDSKLKAPFASILSTGKKTKILKKVQFAEILQFIEPEVTEKHKQEETASPISEKKAETGQLQSAERGVFIDRIFADAENLFADFYPDEKERLQIAKTYYETVLAAQVNKDYREICFQKIEEINKVLGIQAYAASGYKYLQLGFQKKAIINFLLSQSSEQLIEQFNKGIMYDDDKVEQPQETPAPYAEKLKDKSAEAKEALNNFARGFKELNAGTFSEAITLFTLTRAYYLGEEAATYLFPEEITAADKQCKEIIDKSKKAYLTIKNKLDATLLYLQRFEIKSFQKTLTTVANDAKLFGSTVLSNECAILYAVQGKLEQGKLDPSTLSESEKKLSKSNFLSNDASTLLRVVEESRNPEVLKICEHLRQEIKFEQKIIEEQRKFYQQNNKLIDETLKTLNSFAELASHPAQVSRLGHEFKIMYMLPPGEFYDQYCPGSMMCLSGEMHVPPTEKDKVNPLLDTKTLEGSCLQKMGIFVNSTMNQGWVRCMIPLNSATLPKIVLTPTIYRVYRDEKECSSPQVNRFEATLEIKETFSSPENRFKLALTKMLNGENVAKDFKAIQEIKPRSNRLKKICTDIERVDKQCALIQKILECIGSSGLNINYRFSYVDAKGEATVDSMQGELCFAFVLPKVKSLTLSPGSPSPSPPLSPQGSCSPASPSLPLSAEESYLQDLGLNKIKGKPQYFIKIDDLKRLHEDLSRKNSFRPK